MKPFALVFVVVSIGLAQESARDTLSVPDQVLEEFLGEEPLEGVVPDQVDELLDLSENPLDLNRASLRELQRVPALNPLLAYRILSTRERRPFSTVTELLEVEGMTEDRYREIVPFVAVRHGSAGKTSARIRSRVKQDLNEKRGFREGVYAGTREKTLHRLDVGVAVGKDMAVEGRLQTEKDAGEPMKTAFWSGYLQAEFPLMTVLVGDMRTETGRRLLLGRSSMTRIVDPGVSRRSFLSGYRSSDETAFLRGVGLEFRFRQIAIRGFYSNRPMHGTVSDDGVFSPVSDGGLFRTPLEQSKRNLSRERACGASASLNLLDWLTVSATAYHVRFRHPVAVGGNDSPALRDLAGASLSVWFSTTNVAGTGEIAVKRGGGRAGSASLLLEPTTTMRAGFAGNVFDLLYHSPLGIRRSTRSEVGLDAWADIRPMRQWKIGLDWLYVRYPGGRNANEFPEEMKRWRMTTSLKLSSGSEITMEYSIRQSPSEGQRVNGYGLVEAQPVMVGRHHVGGTLVVGGGRSLRWISRIQFVEVNKDHGRGLLLSQQCRWQASQHLSVEGKLILFGIASYDARLHAMEPDVPGTFASRVVFGDGTRAAVLVRARPSPRIELSCSYSVEIRDGQRSLGSGLDEVQGDRRSAVSIQADVEL